MKPRSALMLSSVVFLWSSSFTLLKLGIEEIPPITLAFLRFLIVLPFLTGFTYGRHRHLSGGNILKDWKIFSMLGLTGITLYHVFQNLGLQLTTASNSSLMICANPVFIALLDHFYTKERLATKRVLGIALAFSGVVLVVRPLDWSVSRLEIAGNLLSLGAGLSWAFYSVFGRKVLAYHGADKVTVFSMAYGTLFLLPAALALEKPVLPASAWAWVLLLILSLFCSGLAYLFWSKALEDVSATEAGVFLFFIPLVSVSVAHLVLAESLDILWGGGALLVMAGVVMTERG